MKFFISFFVTHNNDKIKKKEVAGDISTLLKAQIPPPASEPILFECCTLLVISMLDSIYRGAI